MNKIATLLVLILVFSVIPVSPSVLDDTNFAYAQDVSNPIVRPFGGRLTTPPYPCTCSLSWLITVYDYAQNRPIQLMYTPFLSRLNSHYNFATPGNHVLGTYFPVTTSCLYYVGPFCSTYGSPEGTITSWPFSGFGTSLTP